MVEKFSGKPLRNVLLLGLVSFITDTSSEIIMPILPMFIATLGGAGLAIGLIGGLGDSLASIINVFSGYWSDRLGKRKPFVILGYALSAIMKLLFPFSRAWGYLLVFRVFERTGKGLRTAPRDAIIAESAKMEIRGRAFGIHRTLDTSGAIAGSILAFILFWFMGMNFKSILFIAALIAFLSLPPLYFVEERKKRPIAREIKIGLAQLPSSLRFFILIATVFALANFTYMFYILRAQQYFTDRLAIGIPILLYVLFNFVYASLSLPSGILSDRIGRKNTLLMGYSTFVAMSLGFVVASSLPALIILFILYGIVFALVEGNQRAFVSDLADKDFRGMALGTFHTAIGMATLISSLIAGALWEYVSPSMTFLYGAGVASLAVVLFLFVREG